MKNILVFKNNKFFSEVSVPQDTNMETFKTNFANIRASDIESLIFVELSNEDYLAFNNSRYSNYPNRQIIEDSKIRSYRQEMVSTNEEGDIEININNYQDHLSHLTLDEISQLQGNKEYLESNKDEFGDNYELYIFPHALLNKTYTGTITFEEPQDILDLEIENYTEL